jgi:hypothetical protein
MINADVWEEISLKNEGESGQQKSSGWVTFKKVGSKGGWASLDGQYDTASDVEELEDNELDRELFGI